MVFSKSSLRGIFTAIQAYLKKQEKNQINNLTLYQNQLEKKKKLRTPKLVEGKKLLAKGSPYLI